MQFLPGRHNAFTPYAGRHHFGPELQFGHMVGDRFDKQVLIVKTAWGGKSLYKDFRPPSSGGSDGLASEMGNAG